MGVEFNLKMFAGTPKMSLLIAYCFPISWSRDGNG